MSDICEFYNYNELVCDAGSYTNSRIQCTIDQAYDCLWAQDHRKKLKELQQDDFNEPYPSDGLAE